MKIAIGMIVRNLIFAYPLTEFLDNAEKYDHPIERVIVVYSHEADPEAIQELQRKAKVSLIRLQNYERAHMILKQLGVRFSSIQQLLFCPLIDTHGLIPYGFNRNHVLMEALFTGVDYLIFVDSDVLPSVLHRSITIRPVKAGIRSIFRSEKLGVPPLPCVTANTTLIFPAPVISVGTPATRTAGVGTLAISGKPFMAMMEPPQAPWQTV